MSLVLPESNFRTWKKNSANFYFPATCGDQDHIHLTVSIVGDGVKVIAASIKIGGKSTNLRPRSAQYGFKFDPAYATFPPDPLGTQYRQALSTAGIT